MTIEKQFAKLKADAFAALDQVKKLEKKLK